LRNIGPVYKIYKINEIAVGVAGSVDSGGSSLIRLILLTVLGPEGRIDGNPSEAPLSQDPVATNLLWQFEGNRIGNRRLGLCQLPRTRADRIVRLVHGRDMAPGRPFKSD